MKKLLMGTGLLAALAMAALFFVEFDSPALGRAVLERANAATGLTMQARKFSLSLWRGVVVQDLEAKGALGASDLEARCSRLVLQHRFLPLLRGRVAVSGVLLDSPQIELRERKAAKRSSPASVPQPKAGANAEPAGEASAGGGAPGGGPSLGLEVSEIRIENGAASSYTRESKKPAVAVSGLNLVLRQVAFDPKALTPLHGLSARGHLETSQLVLDATKIERLEGELQLGGGRFEVPELSFESEQGKFRASLVVDFNRTPLGYTLKLQGDPLDTNAVLSAGGKGSFGPGRLDFQAEGSGTDSRAVKGKGVLKLQPGTIPSTPVLAAVEKSLGRTALVGARYQATEARFRIERNRVLLEPFQLATEQAAIRLSGWADLEGPLGLQLTLRTPREGLKIKEVRDEVLDALTDDQGWVSLPFKVSGTSAEPSVAPDGQALMAQAKQGAQKVATDKASEELKSFLGKKLK